MTKSANSVLDYLYSDSRCLKLTLPTDVDIPLVRDNLTHYADSFHCNAQAIARLCNGVLTFGFGMNAM